MTFANVYCVTTRLRRIEAASIDKFARDLGVPFPTGYQDYLMSFGQGELCDYLRVHTPQQVRDAVSEEFAWQREGYVQGLEDGWWNGCGLTSEDLANAVTFATSAEGDDFVCCPRLGSALFELPRHGDTINLMDGGFYGAVAVSTQRMEHDFPFFETWGGKSRWLRTFNVRSDLGAAGFIAAVKKCWGAAGFRQSRTASDNSFPNLFVQAIGARFVLYLQTDSHVPPGSFTVSMSHDIESEAEVAAFVETVRFPDTECWSGLSERE